MAPASSGDHESGLTILKIRNRDFHIEIRYAPFFDKMAMSNYNGTFFSKSRFSF